MNGRRDKLAWFILLASFFICVAISIIIPLGINTFIQQSTRELDVNVQANQGTVGILHADNEAGAIFAGDPAQSLEAGGAVLTNDRDTALILISTPDGEAQIARIQVYGNTNIGFERAQTPRFRASTSNNDLQLTLNNGRMLLNIPESASRDLDFSLDVPQGFIELKEEGQYSVMANNNETQVSVMVGEAVVRQDGSSLTLGQDQRAVLVSGAPIQGPLGTERNLIANGKFSDGFEEWVPLASNVELTDQPDVDIVIEQVSEEPAVGLIRTGIGHADAGLRQILSQDVTDFQNLRLLVSMIIAEQSLGVCGQQGSECPLTIRLEYVDTNGVDQVWQQGFFANGVFSPDTPDVCVTCPPPSNVHHQVPFQQLVFYESDNLMERLGQLGIQPRQLKTITIIASGHTFDTKILEIAVVAEE
ncbi:MAG: hypothetical protein BMS9Abin02_1885 [Anaerolineae bacterium]|nr:MAG: hypothetical protein BMS9Abin02_1885 [Anaerolineae bacterium]